MFTFWKEILSTKPKNPSVNIIKKKPTMSKSKYNLSSRSLSKLDGVEDNLVRVVKRAIQLTKVDFGVTCGVRTYAEQKKLVASGASQTMKSKHLTGDAVDVMAYLNGAGSWDLSLYDGICDAMAEAARQEGVAVKWGAAWSEGDIRYYKGTAQEAMDSYVALRRSEGRRPFIDGPHYELIRG